MSVPALEPYATQQRWQARAPLPGEAWQALLAGYLAALARACDAAGPCIIGHIKALALLENGEYLRISVVSATHAPTLDGYMPDGLAAVSLTLNVLVYGLPAAELQIVTWRTAAALAARHDVTVTEEAMRDDAATHPMADKHSHASSIDPISKPKQRRTVNGEGTGHRNGGPGRR